MALEWVFADVRSGLAEYMWQSTQTDADTSGRGSYVLVAQAQSGPLRKRP